MEWSNRTTRFVDAGTLLADIPAPDIATSWTVKDYGDESCARRREVAAVKLGIS
jgi:hypothetical protein